MTETLDDGFQSGIAVLADASNDFDEGAPWTVHGVVIPEGAITQGRSGIETYWPADTLRPAADLLEGIPIVKNFHELEGQAPADDVIGEVTASGYADGVGLLYEGEISDEAIANKVAAGYLDVSPAMSRELGELDDQRGARRAEAIEAFRDLAVVATGASDGNEIEMGPNPAVAALSAEALSQAFGADGGVSGGDSPGGDDGHNDGSGQSTRGQRGDRATWRTHMSDDLTDTEKELLRKAPRFDEPTLVEAAEAKRLTENEALLDDAADIDAPRVVSTDDYNAQQSKIEAMEDVLGGALRDQTDLKEAAIEAMSFEAKVAQFADDDGVIDLEALSQQPETGGDPDDPDGGSNGGDGLDALDAGQRREVKEKLEAAAKRESRLPERAEALRAEAADLAGVDDADEINMEAL